ncbi:MAG: hypothetical protein AAB253_07735, partial [candidate division NC10 bacterium]
DTIVMEAELPGLTQQEMNRLFEGFLGQAPGRMQPVEGIWAQPMDVCEAKTELRVLVELPGIPQAEIQIEIVDGVLKIRGERQPDPAFRQDQYRDGILEIRLLKRPEATPRIISVEAA